MISNKIVSKIKKTNDLKKRLHIIQEYVDRYNKSSYTHYISFYNNSLELYRYDSGPVDKKDLSNYLDISVIRNEVISKIIGD